MAKTGIKNNIPSVVRKIDKDLDEIQRTIGDATADLVNLAFNDIQKKSFLDGRGATKSVGRIELYGDIPGANRGTRKNPDRRAFHKSKVVDRGGSLPFAFVQLTFHKVMGFRKMSVGTNGVAKVEIQRDGSKENPKGQKVNIRWEGKFGDALNKLHFGAGGGKEKIEITNSKGKIQNVRRGQRAIAFNGLKKFMKRWNKYVEFQLTGTIKKANRKKPK
jgi:hypothetical protein